MVAAAFNVALIAFSLALDVFAVCVGVGIRGATRGAKLRIGAAFASAEVLMNGLGVGLGALAGRAIGEAAAYVGFAALIGVGAYMLSEGIRKSGEEFDLSRGFGLAVASLSISMDSLGIGFSIVYIRVPVVVTLAAIALASVTATTLGLTFGGLFGSTIGSRAGLVAGALLMATGALFAALKYAHLQ